MSAINGGYENKDDWYEALKKVAGKHQLTDLVRDKVAWTSSWMNESPKDAFYEEYPEYWED